jgi:predicted transcriptional regulator
MVTTSLKIPDELKQRAILAAEQQGVSPHAFMVGAIAQAAAAAEQRQAFVAAALAAEAQVLETGLSYAATDVHRYIRARAQGRTTEPPVAKSWRS